MSLLIRGFASSENTGPGYSIPSGLYFGGLSATEIEKRDNYKEKSEGELEVVAEVEGEGLGTVRNRQGFLRRGRGAENLADRMEVLVRLRDFQANRVHVQGFVQRRLQIRRTALYRQIVQAFYLYFLFLA